MYVWLWSPAVPSKVILIPILITCITTNGILLMCLNTHLQELSRTPLEITSMQWPSSPIAGEFSSCINISRTFHDQPYGRQLTSTSPAAVAFRTPDDFRVHNEFLWWYSWPWKVTHLVSPAKTLFYHEWNLFLSVILPVYFFSRGQIFNDLLCFSVYFSFRRHLFFSV